jgi:sugar lactone lactonase YvrE
MLYASDFLAAAVFRWAGDEKPAKVLDVPAQPSGLGWDPDGNMLVVSMGDRRLLRYDGTSVTEVADLSSFTPHHLNDMVIDRAGRAYIGNVGWEMSPSTTDITTTDLFRVDPDGSVTVVAGDLVCPNGMAITADGTTLLVNETFAARITAFEIGSDGSLSGRRVWASFTGTEFVTLREALGSGAVLPDGLAMDSEGAVWIADCQGTSALRVVEGGEVVDRVSTDPHSTYAVAVGGADGKTLFLVTNVPLASSGTSETWQGTMRRVPVDVGA